MQAVPDVSLCTGARVGIEGVDLLAEHEAGGHRVWV